MNLELNMNSSLNINRQKQQTITIIFIYSKNSLINKQYILLQIIFSINLICKLLIIICITYRNNVGNVIIFFLETCFCCSSCRCSCPWMSSYLQRGSCSCLSWPAQVWAWACLCSDFGFCCDCESSPSSVPLFCFYCGSCCSSFSPSSPPLSLAFCHQSCYGSSPFSPPISCPSSRWSYCGCQKLSASWPHWTWSLIPASCPKTSFPWISSISLLIWIWNRSSSGFVSWNYRSQQVPPMQDHACSSI